MHVASLELCKELYELSGWRDTRFFYKAITGQDYMIVAQPDYGKHRDREPTTYKWDESPAYDLGYLLRKMPQYIGYVSQACRLGLFPQGFTSPKVTQWCASYDTYKGEIYLLQLADTPENALCQLAIELFKQGILKREDSHDEK